MTPGQRTLGHRTLGQRLLAGFVLPALLVCLAYAALLHAALAPSGFNPLAIARLSREFAAERYWDHAPVFDPGTGYDGQFFYYLARDPLVRGGVAHLDAPAYRYQRLLYPLAARALVLGDPAKIAWSLVATNLIALAVGCWSFSRILLRLGAHPAWLIPYALNPGYWLGIQLDLSEPLALSLATAAVLARLHGRHVLAVGLLTAGLFARETLLTVALVCAGYELWHRRPIRAALYAVPIVPFAAWQCVVLALTGAWAFRTGAAHLGVPLAGAVGLIQRLALSAGDMENSQHLPLAVATGLAVAAVVVVALASLLALRSGTWASWHGAAQAALLLMLPSAVWEPSLYSLPRAGMLLYLFLLIAGLERRARRHPGFRPAAQLASLSTPPAPAIL